MVTGWVSKGPDHVVACVLRGVRARIQDERQWTTHRNACDASDLPTSAGGDDACRWCVSGAVIAECGVVHIGTSRYATPQLTDVVRDFATQVARTGIVKVNDTRGHAATLAMIDKAIAKAEKRAKKAAA